MVCITMTNNMTLIMTNVRMINLIIGREILENMILEVIPDKICNGSISIFEIKNYNENLGT